MGGGYAVSSDKRGGWRDCGTQERSRLETHLLVRSAVSDSLHHRPQPPRLLRPRTSQTRILEWAAISSSRGSSRPGDQTHISHVSFTAGKFFIIWAIWEVSYRYAGVSNRKWEVPFSRHQHDTWEWTPEAVTSEGSLYRECGPSS